VRFELVDRVLELKTDRIVAVKAVSAAEEYLQDHFPTFPVLPGVMMLEAMVQAARRLLESRDGGGRAGPPWVLGKVRALKYGRFVRPGDTLVIEVSNLKDNGDGSYDARGEIRVTSPGPVRGDGEPAPEGEGRVAASGRLTLRPVRVARAG
jgi:3-hydroxyacyl-[acyl-carrier-protein] dehydratase